MNDGNSLVTLNGVPCLSWENTLIDAPPNSCYTQNGSKNVKHRNCLELGARSQLSTLEGVEGRAEAPGLD